MAKLITFLGDTNLTPSENYYQGDGIKKTNYLADSLIDIFNKNIEKKSNITEVLVFVTKEAREKNYESDSDNPKGRMVKAESPSNEKLKQVIKSNKHFNGKIRAIDIEGDDKLDDKLDAYWRLFEKISENIDDGDEIVFDITYSFRYIPMITMLVIHYARTVKTAKVTGIFYGKFIRGTEDVPSKVDIINLNMMADLQDWITSIYTLSNTGDARLMSEWLGTKHNENTKNSQNSKSLPEHRGIDEVAKIWSQLDFSIKINDSTKRKKLAKDLIIEINKLNIEKLDGSYRLAFEAYNKQRKYIERMAGADQVLSDLATIQWNMDKKQYQPAVTVMNELTISVLIKCLDGDYRENVKNSSRRDQVGKVIKMAVHENSNEGKEEIKLKDREIESIKKALNANKELYKTIKESWNVRNFMNHAGYVDKAFEDLEEIKVIHKKFERYIKKLNEDMVSKFS